jgi:hypothetical protein
MLKTGFSVPRDPFGGAWYASQGKADGVGVAIGPTVIAVGSILRLPRYTMFFLIRATHIFSLLRHHFLPCSRKDAQSDSM